MSIDSIIRTSADHGDENDLVCVVVILGDVECHGLLQP